MKPQQARRRNTIRTIRRKRRNEGENFNTQVSVFATGTPAVGTSSASPAYPASISAGQGILICVTNKIQNAKVICPSGFRRLPYADAVSWNASNATDSGPVRGTVFYKVASGTESGTVTLNTINANATNGSMVATIIVLSKDAAANLNIEVSAGHHNVPNTGSYSSRSWRKLNSRANDYYLVFTSLNTDHGNNTSVSAQALSQSGANITTITQELLESGTSSGNDTKQYLSLFKVASGSATDYLTHTSTIATSGATHPIGITMFIRLRQTRATQVFRSSGLISHNPDDAVQTTVDASGGIGNGLRTDCEPSSNISIVTYNGKNHWALDADFRDNVVRRRQEILNTPINIWHVEGTITNWGFQFSVDDLREPALQEIFLQCHTGSAGSTPNHPIVYFEIVKDGQFSGVPGGCLNIKLGMSTDPIYVQPQISGNYIDITGTKTHFFKCEAKWHRTTGYLYVWYKDNTMSDYTQIVNQTNVKLVADTAEELGSGVVGTGSTPLVAPHIKIGPYCHQMDDTGDITTNTTPPYSHDRFNMLLRSFKLVETHPDDIDYADRTIAREDIEVKDD